MTRLIRPNFCAGEKAELVTICHRFRTMKHSSALSDLKLRRLDVIHAGEQTFPLEKSVRAVAITRLLDDLQPLR